MPLLPKATSLIRPDFRCTKILKYYYIVPSRKATLPMRPLHTPKTTSLIRPDFRCTKILKYYYIVLSRKATFL